jgi:hypothetical protein
VVDLRYPVVRPGTRAHAAAAPHADGWAMPLGNSIDFQNFYFRELYVHESAERWGMGSLPRLS